MRKKHQKGGQADENAPAAGDVVATSIRDLVEEDEGTLRELEILIRQELNPELEEDWVTSTLRLVPNKLILTFSDIVRGLIKEMQDDYKESEQTSAGTFSSHFI